MSVEIRMLLAIGFVACLPFLSAKEEGQDAAVELSVLGEVPEGWQVVELADAAPIEKWVKLKNGEERKILLKPFALQPVSNEQAKFTVANPLKTSSGREIETVLDEQNENLAASGNELSTMLGRLKQLLLSLPNQSQEKTKS